MSLAESQTLNTSSNSAQLNSSFGSDKAGDSPAFPLSKLTNRDQLEDKRKQDEEEEEDEHSDWDSGSDWDEEEDETSKVSSPYHSSTE